MFSSIKKWMRWLINSIEINSSTRTKPISAVFGLDRGTPIDRYYIEKFIDNNKGSVVK
jgi:hypothetical protein